MANFITEQNHRLKKSDSVGSIADTTNTDANRKRYSRGIFLSQIYLSQGEHRPRNIKFAVRLICGNKASNCTNNASRSVSVVETLSHLLGDISNLLTNTETITMKTILNPITLGGTFPIPFTSAIAEVCNG